MTAGSSKSSANCEGPPAPIEQCVQKQLATKGWASGLKVIVTPPQRQRAGGTGDMADIVWVWLIGIYLNEGRTIGCVYIHTIRTYKW